MRFGFGRLVQRLDEVLAALPQPVDVLWQLGPVPAAPQTGRAVTVLTDAELEQALRAADVVVAHAGVGSSLLALAAGKRPLLVPRRVAHGEHVDDHQGEIAAELARRGLAVTAEAEEVSVTHLRDTGLLRVCARSVTDIPLHM
jgi:UDP-N-acetylglucosamine--N-acetylmuramyl-(pentapeptide) pyrophosphoryl-undecaprenol N-acetylglucosamine transferase